MRSRRYGVVGNGPTSHLWKGMFMVTVHEALDLIKNSLPTSRVQPIRLDKANGLYLASDVAADRDFPPYHRVAMDGIALHLDCFNKGERRFPIEGIVRAGEKPQALKNPNACLEVMTGAMLPEGTNMVIPYEQIKIVQNAALLTENIKAEVMMNVHQRGSDVKQGHVILKRGARIFAPEIAALASVGMHTPLVFSPLKIAVISTGDELVEIDNPHPKDYQIRKSNPYAIKTLIETFGPFHVDLFHLNDEQDLMMKKIAEILDQYEMVLLSGGVSAGKFDFVPSVLRDLKVKEIFHKIKQRPGKPLWFGQGPQGQLVFGLPGNPISALFSCRRYVITALGWIISGGQFEGIFEGQKVISDTNYKAPKEVSFFRPCVIKGNVASFYLTNGSGDLLSLSGSDGFIELPPDREIKVGHEILTFSWRRT